MQQEAVELYSKIRSMILDGRYEGKSRDHVVYDVISRLKAQAGIIHWRNRKQYWYYPYPRENRKFKPYLKNKYHSLGLKSREQEMLRKMINSVIDDLVDTDESFGILNDAFNKANACSGRVKQLNVECDSIISELEKISGFMDTGKWETQTES